MWMMGYSDAGGEFSMPDSFNGRKLRPLIPRPVTSSTTNNNSNTSTPTPPCLSRIHGTDFFSLNHHHHHLGSHFVDQNKREFNTPPVVVSSRWNPTPEQLRTLEELYRRGTRTPSAEQIQHITAQLRRYGKIEGKNVFYWFQNHKARERQKRRRQMELSSPDHHHINNNNNIHDVEIFERKDHSTGANRTGYEVQQTKINNNNNNNNNWAAPTNCSTLSEESGGMQIRAAKGGVLAECRAAAPGGWIQLDEGELQQRSRNFVERNATWQQMMQLSCPSPTHLINTNLISTTSTSTSTTANSNNNSNNNIPAPLITTMDQKQLSKNNVHDISIFISPYKENIVHGCLGQYGGFDDDDDHLNTVNNIGEDDDHDQDQCGSQFQTLQLFPLRSGDPHGGINQNNLDNKAINESVSSIDANLMTPCQFIEFLPLKN